MRYETIVEITPDGRPALRLVIVEDEPPATTTQDVPHGPIIISYDEKDPFTVDENIVSWEV